MIRVKYNDLKAVANGKMNSWDLATKLAWAKAAEDERYTSPDYINLIERKILDTVENIKSANQGR